jgi:hypothetical protein
MQRIIRKSHRLLGLMFSVTILMSSGSGVVHVVMTRTQAPPPATQPTESTIYTAQIRITPADAFKDRSLTAISIRNIGGEPFYQATLPDHQGLTYVSAVTGRSDPQADARYAKQIASAFLSSEHVVQTEYLTDYNSEYINIFRILPVYRFDLKDRKGTRVYVSTMTGSVMRHTDNQKQFEASLFTNFHKLGFIPNKNLRDGVLVTITAAAFLLSLLGIVLYFLTSPRKRSHTPVRQSTSSP